MTRAVPFARLTSNDVIGMMRDRPRFIVKTMTRVGPVYSFSDALKPIPREVIERQISKGILVPHGDRGQTFALAPSWSGS